MKSFYFSLSVAAALLWVGCTRSEPQISKRHNLQIERMVEYKLDSFRRAQQTICYQNALKLAEVEAARIIAEFETAAARDTSARPDRPKRPAKPEVKIPDFE